MANAGSIAVNVQTLTIDEQHGITRKDDLTDEEGRVMDAACEVANAWAALPVEHPMDSTDVCNAVHAIQDLLAVRIARRHYPKGWPTKGAEA